MKAEIEIDIEDINESIINGTPEPARNAYTESFQKTSRKRQKMKTRVKKKNLKLRVLRKSLEHAAK